MITLLDIVYVSACWENAWNFFENNFFSFIQYCKVGLVQEVDTNSKYSICIMKITVAIAIIIVIDKCDRKRLIAISDDSGFLLIVVPSSLITV